MKRRGPKALSRAALALSLAFGLYACALLGKGKPLELRYFDLSEDGGNRPTAPAESLHLRLGSVSAARHIDRRFISRRGEHEITYYDKWRWTDQPDAFLRRKLERDLFERAGLTRVVSGPGPTLEVALIAFEEIKLPERQQAHVELAAALQDERVQLWQQSFRVDAAVGPGDPAEALAAALGRALAQATAQVTEHTVKTLSSREAAKAAAEKPEQGPAR